MSVFCRDSNIEGGGDQWVSLLHFMQWGYLNEALRTFGLYSNFIKDALFLHERYSLEVY